jgi:hypothetical protein
MDIDIHGLKRNFIKKFVVDEKRELADIELNSEVKRNSFIKKMLDPGNNILDKKLMRVLNEKVSSLEVTGELKLDEHDLCYVISGDGKIDDKVMQVDFALKSIHEGGLGGILVNLRVDRLYIEETSRKKYLAEFIKTA